MTPSRASTGTRIAASSEDLTPALRHEVGKFEVRMRISGVAPGEFADGDRPRQVQGMDLE